MSWLMSWLQRILLVTLLSVPKVSFALKPQTQLRASENLIAGCRIHDRSGKFVRQFAGNYCQFMSDGRYLSADSTRLAMFNPEKTIIWTRPGHFHHQLNWTYDRKAVLALSSKVERIDGKPIRVDVLQKIDLNGNLLSEISSQTIFEQLKISRARTPFDWDPEAKDLANFEISHFNSFYEIPPLNSKSKQTEIAAGNFIANSTLTGSVILSADLSRALKLIQFRSSNNQSVHDVQVLTTGQILFLNNDRISIETGGGPHSSVEFLDPVTQKSTFVFTSKPKEMFYTAISGGVQPVGPNHLLISHASNAFYLLNKRDMKIEESGIFRDANGGPMFRLVQQTRLEDINDFLKKW